MASILATFNREISDLIHGSPRTANAALDGERRADRSAMAKARRLAAKHGVTIESDGPSQLGNFWVTHPGIECESTFDPLDGNHFCTSGREVLDAVTVYALHLTAA